MQVAGAKLLSRTAPRALQDSLKFLLTHCRIMHFFPPARLECRLHDQEAIERSAGLKLPFEGRRTMTAETKTWQELCEAVSHESNPTRLMALIAELMRALDERDQSANANA
jgi:hypothetical protein